MFGCVVRCKGCIVAVFSLCSMWFVRLSAFCSMSSVILVGCFCVTIIGSVGRSFLLVNGFILMLSGWIWFFRISIDVSTR